jgi:hypothetical protein
VKRARPCHRISGLTSAGKRLAERKKGERTQASPREWNADSAVILSKPVRGKKPKRDPGTVSVSSSQVESIIRNSDSPLSSDHRLLPLPNHSLFSALFHNGVILGLACSTSTISKSLFASTHIPESLRPTPLQAQNVHFQWIDRFPFPRMRDKMIEFTDLYSAEDFLGDIFSTATFNIKPGYMSWDPEAWVVNQGFKEKWKLLLDDPKLTIQA